MHRFTWVAKGLLGFILAVIAFDIIMLCYSFSVVSSAMDDTLDTIAAMVAEENCLDKGLDGGKAIKTTVDPKVTISKDSNVYSALSVMVENAPIWLTYNQNGMSEIKDGSNWIPKNPTNTQLTALQGKTDDAIKNVDVNCLTLNGTSINSDITYFSYENCPQRGTPITVELTGYWTIQVLPHFGKGAPWDGSVNFQIKRSVTVVGTKFYKGK